MFAISFQLFHPGFAAHFHAAATSLEILSNSSDAQDRTAGWKVRPLHEFPQLIERNVRVVDLRANPIDHFAKIVRRNVRRHADGNTGAAIHQKIRKRARKNRRLGPGLVVIRNEIDRVLLHVGHERSAEMRHARFGVTHCCRRIAFDRTEISLTVD